jgi:ABC-2 type transport system permease protein
MSTATLAVPRPAMPYASTSARPGLGRLTRVELRKMVDTRAGFWLQIATVALTVAVVAVRCVVGDAADHTLRSVLSVGLQPANILLPVVGILLVSSEWSQRTGLITFALVPVRSRVLAAKLLASLLLALAMWFLCLAIVVAGVALAAPGVEGTWSSLAPLVGQSTVYLTTSMVIGVAFGALLLASAPAIVASFAAPTACAALASLPVFSGVGPWLDYSRAVSPMGEEVLSATQWAHAGTALVPWMLLTLVAGAWRISRRDVTA